MSWQQQPGEWQDIVKREGPVALFLSAPKWRQLKGLLTNEQIKESRAARGTPPSREIS